MLLLIGSFLLLLVIGAPVAVAMAVASLLYLGIYDVAPDIIAAQRMIAGVESFPLIAVPFFILAGNLMNIAGVTGRIYHFALSLVGWMKGGLAQVNIIGSVIFSGMSGTALADAAGIGTIEIKAMKDHGYPVEAAVGVTAASATLGPIFPPSLPFVIYGMMANASIGALFMAGIIPGIVMTSLMMLTVWIFARRYGWGSDTPFDFRELAGAFLEVIIVLCFPLSVWLLIQAGLSVNIAVFLALGVLIALDWYFDWHAVMALMAPVLLIGGMTMGWFTPTEAAVAAVLWSLFLGLVRYRTMTFRTLAKASFDTIETTAAVLFIVTAASIFAWLLTVSQAAQLFSDFMFGLTDNWWTFLIVVNILLLVVGAFLDTIAAISILVPILMPVAARYGIDPVHLGIILTLNLMIGLLTPPVGMVLFVLSRIAKMSVERTALAILPWMIPLFVALLLITFIPAITLWLPTQLGLIRSTSPPCAAASPAFTPPMTCGSRKTRFPPPVPARSCCAWPRAGSAGRTCITTTMAASAPSGCASRSSRGTRPRAGSRRWVRAWTAPPPARWSRSAPRSPAGTATTAARASRSIACPCASWAAPCACRMNRGCSATCWWSPPRRSTPFPTRPHRPRPPAPSRWPSAFMPWRRRATWRASAS